MQNADFFVVAIILAVVIIWALYWLNRWLTAPVKIIPPFLYEPSEAQGPVVDLLEQNGYEIVSGKLRIPMKAFVDDKPEPYKSTVYIDFFARLNKEIYAVKVARKRNAIEWTGSGLRDRLLVYTLLYNEIAGVLYVEPETEQIRKINFELERD